MRYTHLVPVEGEEVIALDWYVPEEPKGARTAVFIHGFGSERRGDKAVHFAERFEAMGWHYLALDLRGHGDSSGGMETLTLSRSLADLTAALDWLPPGQAPPVLIGSSMGGAVAAWHRALRPARSGAIALIAPAFSFPHDFTTALSTAEVADWRKTGRHRFVNQWLDVVIGYDLVTDAASYDPARLVREFAAPTLILQGMEDEAVDWRASLKFVEDSPCATLELVLFKDGDHRLTDRKELLFDTIAAWLERLPELETGRG